MGMKYQPYTTFPLGNDRKRNSIGVDVVGHQMEEEVQLVLRTCQYWHDVSKVLSTFIVLCERYVEDARVHGFIPYGMGGDGFEEVPDAVLDFFRPLSLR